MMTRIVLIAAALALASCTSTSTYDSKELAKQHRAGHLQGSVPNMR